MILKVVLRILVLVQICYCANNELVSQCTTPFGTSFTAKTKTSVDFRWTDPNTNPLGWDVEIVEKGNQPTGTPHNSTLITEKQYQITQLAPSTFYEIYIRAVCTDTQKSTWNGPFVVSTVLENPTKCGVALDLKDNGTETFLIDIPNSGLLGKDLFLESVELIVEHEWPADVLITLHNPAGKSTRLARYNGTGNKNFGNPEDMLCFQTTQFTDQACTPFQESSPPFNGVFLPAEPLNLLHDQSQAKGNWRLVFHDRAAFHRGKVQFVNIRLSTEKCILPEDFFLSEINSNSVLVNWQSVPSCQSIKIVIKEVGKPADQERVFFLNCMDESFRIPNLNPETEYEIFYQSVCGSTLSTSSCIQVIKTNCKPTTIQESFDDDSDCIQSCQFTCDISGMWKNHEDNIQNWTTWQKETDTENTGPNGDISGGGKYIYIESQPDFCGINPVVLMSECIRITSNSDGCDASFSYHMSGSGIGSLSFEVSTDGGETWESVWQKSGDQGTGWKRTLLSLEPYHNAIVLLRFIAQPTQSIYGDIALDQIEFYGSQLMPGQFIYYRDSDGDTFGSNIDSIQICRSEPPEGFVTSSGDCDDHHAGIYPGANEIVCNLIDENCNGPGDDKNPLFDLQYQFSIVNETCKGQKNGRIELEILGGNPPYRVTWNTGATTTTLLDIGEGIYYCTISDADSCSLQSEFITITSLEQMQVLVTNSNRPSCLGIGDGAVFINHSGGLQPFTYNWSNGSASKDLMNVGEGLYTVTVTDINGCFAVSTPFQLQSLPGISAGPVQIKHPSCFQSKNGEIEIGALNAVMPVTYLWDNGVSQAINTELGAGIYFCTVTDARGCIANVEINLTAPDSLHSFVINVEPVRCFGEKNGIINTNTAGGTQPYLYFWNNGFFTDDIFDLAAGKYSLTVTDKNGCTSTLQNIDVPQPQPLRSNVADVESARCLLGENGKITLTSTGGSPPYHYSWNVGSATDTSVLENVKFGVYSAVIFDALGCKFSLGSILLPYINMPLHVDLNVVRQNICADDTNGVIQANVADGSPPFDFNWSTGWQHIVESASDSIKNLGSGNYSVTVTDHEGCVGTSEIKSLPSIPPLQYVIEKWVQNTCLHDSNGEIKILIRNNKGPVQIRWVHDEFSLHISQLENGLYSANVVDSVGCMLQIPPIEITSVSNLTVNPVIVNTSTQINNGSVCLSIEGAVGNYRIEWGEKISATSGNCAYNLAFDNYIVTITDEAGCEEIVTFLIDFVNSTTEENVSQIWFFPNPVQNELFCHPMISEAVLEIMDIRGALKYVKPANQDCKTISMESFPSGVYIIKVVLNHKIYLHKIVKL